MLSRVRLFVTPWMPGPTSPSPTPRVYQNSCPSSPWCHPTTSSSVIPFSSCLHSFPASGSFPVNQFFASGSQSIRVSASASVFPMNIQDQFPLGWTGWISLQSKGLSRVFSNTTVQKHQFFSGGDTPCPRVHEKPQQDGRRGKIVFRIKPHTRQRCSEGSNKPWAYQDPATPQWTYMDPIPNFNTISQFFSKSIPKLHPKLHPIFSVKS